MGDIVGSVTDILFGKPPEQPDLPKVEIPAAPAPNRREDTGANVVVGSDAGARVSGRGTGTGTKRTLKDVIGGLGSGGGLSI